MKPIPVFVDATGREREPPHCPTCSCHPPSRFDDVVGLLAEAGALIETAPVHAHGERYREWKDRESAFWERANEVARAPSTTEAGQ